MNAVYLLLIAISISLYNLNYKSIKYRFIERLKTTTALSLITYPLQNYILNELNLKQTYEDELSSSEVMLIINNRISEEESSSS